jgi:hypothetical protein
MLALSLLMLISPLGVFASATGSGVAGGCPSLNGAMQQPSASFLAYTDSGGAISVQTNNVPNNALISICVYSQGGTAGYSQTISPSISSLWSAGISSKYFEWGRMSGPNTLPIDGTSYNLGTVSPDPTIQLFVAHVIGTECGGAGMTCFFVVPVNPCPNM